MSNQALSFGEGWFIWGNRPPNRAKIGHFGCFQCKITRLPPLWKTLLRCKNIGVGQPVRRKEDDTLVRGKGKYTDDFDLPGQAFAWIVRSSHAHGILRGIDTSAARAMPGVLGVWTGTDLAAANYGPFTCGLPLKSRDGTPAVADQPYRADDRQGALCRRPRGVRGGRDAGAGPRCRRGRGGRYRSAAGRHGPRGRGKTGRAAALRPHPQQCGARLSLSATPPRSRPRSPAPRMSRSSISSTPASRSSPWSRARRSPPTTRRASATRFRFRPRASPATGSISPRTS